jgi:DNA invertase Pin-like site-specific DNA recombinase
MVTGEGFCVTELTALAARRTSTENPPMLGPAHRRTEEPAPLAVAYARVSTAEQPEGGMSLDAQLGAIRAYAKQRSLTLVHEYVERGATGTDDGRPEFQRMIESLFAPSNTVTTVLVLHTSRFMRDVELARRYKRELRRKGVRVVAVQQEVGDDPNGELMEGVYELFDQHESRIIGVRTRAAMNENARAGYFNGASPPFGFAIEHVTGPGGRAKRRLVPDAEEARVVKLIFERYVAGAGAKALAKQLNGEGLRYRRRPWSRDHVLGVLGDRSAIGDYRWGRRESRTGKKRDAHDQVRVSVPSIVDAALFDAAERAREARDPKEPDARHGRPPSQLLGGLLRCTRCGGRFQLETSGKRDPNGKPTYRYYNCSTTCRTGQDACPGYRSSAETLERAVLRFLAEELFTPERCRGFLHDVLASQDTARTASAARRRELEATLADLNARIARWTDAFESGGDLADLGVDRLRKLRAKREEAERALHAEAATVSAPPPYLYKEETLARFTSRLRTAFADPASDLARAYVERLVERIDLGEGDVTVRPPTSSRPWPKKARSPQPATAPLKFAHTS